MAARGRQDLPPQGGFDPVRYKRNIPKRGPSGAVLLAGGAAVSIYGFYVYLQGVQQMRCCLSLPCCRRCHRAPAGPSPHSRAPLRSDERLPTRMYRDVTQPFRMALFDRK